MPRQLFLISLLFFVTAAQAVQGEKQSEHKESLPVPAAATPLPAPESRLPDLGEEVARDGDQRRNARYGTGYEARQGRGAGVQGSRGGRGR